MTQCTKRIYTGLRRDFGGHACRRKANGVYGGKALCAIHSPDGQEKRRKAADARYEARREKWRSLNEKQEHDKRKLAAFDDVLAALERLLQDEAVLDDDDPKLIETRDIARAVIAKSKGAA